MAQNNAWYAARMAARALSTRKLRPPKANPATGLTGLAIAGIVVAAVAGAYGIQKLLAKTPPRRCPVLKPSGGIVKGIRYEEFVTGGASPNDTLPMVIVFHGRGSSPKFLLPILKDISVPARIIVPYGIIPFGKNHAWWTTKSKGNQAQLTKEMREASKRLAPFAEKIALCRPTKGDIAVVAGHSQGSMMALALAATQADKIDLAVGGSGWLPEEFWSSTSWAPIVLIHGSEDTAVPYQRTADMVETLKKKGVKIELVSVQGHGHSLAGALKLVWLKGIEAALSWHSNQENNRS